MFDVPEGSLAEAGEEVQAAVEARKELCRQVIWDQYDDQVACLVHLPCAMGDRAKLANGKGTDGALWVTQHAGMGETLPSFRNKHAPTIAQALRLARKTSQDIVRLAVYLEKLGIVNLDWTLVRWFGGGEGLFGQVEAGVGSENAVKCLHDASHYSLL